MGDRWALEAFAALFAAVWAAAAWAVRRGRVRLGGVLLILSAATPTYFAWALNVPALVIGLAATVNGSRTRGAAHANS